MKCELPGKRRRRGWRRLYATAIALVIICCLCGLGLAAIAADAIAPTRLAQVSRSEEIGTVDR
ncbi:MAG: diheme cytochrome C, partial [Microcoleus sp.]